MKSWSRLDWLIVFLFAGLVALFYWRILTPNPADRQSFPPGDFYAQFWAFTTFEARELSAGRLPLWNPYNFAGSPFWADVQAAVFYPLSLFTLLFSAPGGFSAFALELEAMVHFWLAAVFMYLFGREVTASRPAAVIAALTFTFGGYLTGYPGQQLAVLEADIWLPLICFFLHRVVRPRATPISHLPTPTLLLAGVALGMTLLAGHPQSAFIVVCISLSYLTFLLFLKSENGAPYQSPPGGHKQNILHFIYYVLLFLFTGLALAAIQFIPAIEYTLLSVRAEGTYDKMSGGFPLVDVIQFLLPGQVSRYSPLYVGVVGLILAVWAVLTLPARNRYRLQDMRRNNDSFPEGNNGRDAFFWGLIAAIALLISFGGNTFLYTPLYLTIPGFSIFRGQERWAFAAAFSLSILAGYGFKALLERRDVASNVSTKVTRLGGVLSLTQNLFLLALLLVFIFFFGLNQTGWKSESPFFGLLGAATLLTILLALAWLLWKFGPQLPPAIFTALTAGLICFDLFSVNWQTNLFPQPPEWHTQTPAVVAAIKKDAAKSPDEPYRVYNEFRLYDNYGVPFEIEDLWGASPLRLSRYDRFLAPPMPIERAWELLNVKYVITWRKELYLPSTIIYEEPTDKDTTYVHRLDHVSPRAWLVTRAEIADDQTILQKIADPDFDRWQIVLLEPGTESLLAEGHREMLDPASTSSNQTKRPDEVLPTSDSQKTRLTYHVVTDVPALLVLSEIDYPGWLATVDGQLTSVLRADYVLRAVPIPAGEHTIELTFRPFSFTIGAIISGSMIATLVVAFILSTWRNYKKVKRNPAVPI